jgi:acyl-[acyl-carrier-protein] desaturase
VLADQSLTDALAPEVEKLVHRHLDTTKEWFPHQLVPWDRAVGTDPAGEWNPDTFPLPDGVRSSLFVNLLTEDNLPYYFQQIDRLFGSDSPWREWNRRWTAEEGRHSIVIRDYLTVSGAIDPVELERARMHQVGTGQVPAPDHAIDGIAYVALQELATRIAHRNTGKALDDKAGLDVMARVAADENLHYLFYRDLMSRALEVDPSGAVCAIERQVRDFEMPGTGIPDFGAHAKAIANEGIYDLEIHHDQVLVPCVVRHWKIDQLTGLDDEAETARAALFKRMERIAKAGRRMTARRAERTPVAAG